MLDFCVDLRAFLLHGILMGAMTSYQARACKLGTQMCRQDALIKVLFW